MTETTPKIRDFPPAPRDFDPLTASRTDLLRHGLPQRPAEVADHGLELLWPRLPQGVGQCDHLGLAGSRRGHGGAGCGR